jgi:hypothetical protein
MELHDLPGLMILSTGRNRRTKPNNQLKYQQIPQIWKDSSLDSYFLVLILKKLRGNARKVGIV